jgi:hypothetical protein
LSQARSFASLAINVFFEQRVLYKCLFRKETVIDSLINPTYRWW